MTKVSIIVTNYNQGKYLHQCFESVYKQTFTDWELIFLDDSNVTDDATLRDFQMYTDKTDNKIYYIKTNDVGATYARDKGIQIAIGEYYLPLDIDDRLEPTFLEKTVKTLDENKNYSFAYVDTLYILPDKKIRVPSKPYSFMELLMNNFISYCSLFRRQDYLDVRYNLNNFCYFEDYELYIRLGMNGKYGIYIPEDLFLYTVREDSSMNTDRTQKLSGIYKAYIISQYPQIFPLDWVRQAQQIMNDIPTDFMSWKPARQEEYAKQIKP